MTRMDVKRKCWLRAAALLGLAMSGSWAIAQPTLFASRVIAYQPSVSQNAQNPVFNDPQRALGAPQGGGTTSPDNSKVVTLGSFGGSITLGFDGTIVNHPPSPANPLGADLIVFGNAFYVFGSPSLRWMEPGVVEVSRDVNANGLADDAWYLVRGSRWIEGEASTSVGVRWTQRVIDGSSVPLAWLPAGRSSAQTWTESGWELFGEGFAGAQGSPVVADPSDGSITWGYADCSPTMVLGDMDGDGTADVEGMNPARFYTNPPRSDRSGGAVTAWSGGGDAVALENAVDASGQPAALPEIDFVRIRSAVVSSFASPFGESSVEVGGVAKVVVRARADMAGQGGALGPDGVIDNNDFIVFIDLFFSQHVLADIGIEGGAEGSDGAFDNNDFIVFVSWVFAGE
jgi:hypothetical protein